jgi:glycosyltransferase involved in cell wall biosynthesis
MARLVPDVAAPGFPTLSIGLPVFNGERYLEHALESLLAQSFGDFELILSDNASTDRTETICRSVAARDPRVLYVRNRSNIGAAPNFNQVFRLSSGRYFKWAAHDDVCGPDLARRCLEVLEGDPSVVLVCATPASIDASGELLRRQDPGPDMTSNNPAARFKNLMGRPFWATPLFGVIRSDALERTGLHGSTLAGDHVLLAELSLHGRFIELQEDLFFHRDLSARYASPPSLVVRANHIDPTLPGSDMLLRLGQVRGYLSAIARSPVAPAVRARCYQAVGRWVAWRAVVRVPRLAARRSSDAGPHATDEQVRA